MQSRRRAHQATALELRLVYVDELILVEAAVDYEVEEGDGRHQRLNEAEDQTEQHRHAAIGNLPAVVDILLFPQPSFGPLSVRHPRLEM